MLLVQQVARPEGATSASAERQPLPHRLPLRSIPPAALRLRAPSHSRWTWASTVCAEEFPTPLEASVRRGWTGLSEVSC